MKQITYPASGKWAHEYFLFGPLGWIATQLGPVAETDPVLLRRLATIDVRTMHLVGLALAHMRRGTTDETCAFLLRQSEKKILKALFGEPPAGIGRALKHLPRRALAQQTYKSLIVLLSDRVVGRFLQHASSIDDGLIASLQQLPKSLRTKGIMKLFGEIGGLINFVGALNLVATRSGTSIDFIAQDLGALNQPAQIVSAIRALVDGLPLPAGPPKCRIGSFFRIDNPAYLRALGKSWRNCLGDCVFAVNDGTHSVYLSEEMKAVALVRRYGRLGWVLAQAKGPANIDLPAHQLADIGKIFSQAEVAAASECEAIRRILAHRPTNDDAGDHLIPFLGD